MERKICVYSLVCLAIACLWEPVGFEIVYANHWFPLLFGVGSSECEVDAVVLGV